MQHHDSIILNEISKKEKSQSNSLRSRAEDLLVAIAVLGLVATIADGEAELREIETFAREFKKRFALSRRQSLKIIGLALKRIRTLPGTNVIDCACDTLNVHLDTQQKLGIFEALSEVLIADGHIHRGEEYFLDYIASKLSLLQSLEKRYPAL